MKHIKITLLIASLLATGFIAGFHTHRYLATRKIRQVAELRLSRGFQTRFFEVVQATDEQRDVLAPIVEKYGVKMAEVHRSFRQDRQAVTDSLLLELRPHLNEAQRIQLEQFNRPFRGRRTGDERRKEPDAPLRRPD